MESTEKVSVNMNVGTLSQIDLLVDMGYYSNRSDFINQSAREALDKKRAVLDGEAQRRGGRGDWFTGIYIVTEEQLLRAKEIGRKIRISGYGLVVIDKKLDDLAAENIESIDVRGKVRCSESLRARLGL